MHASGLLECTAAHGQAKSSCRLESSCGHQLLKRPACLVVPRGEEQVADALAQQQAAKLPAALARPLQLRQACMSNVMGPPIVVIAEGPALAPRPEVAPHYLA